jgi:hypothetical protein
MGTTFRKTRLIRALRISGWSLALSIPFVWAGYQGDLLPPSEVLTPAELLFVVPLLGAIVFVLAYLEDGEAARLDEAGGGEEEVRFRRFRAGARRKRKS